MICGTISGRTVKLTYAPQTTKYQGTFSGNDVIEGTYTDSAGMVHALSYTRVVADTPTLLGIGAQCTGFPYGK